MHAHTQAHVCSNQEIRYALKLAVGVDVVVFLTH